MASRSRSLGQINPRGSHHKVLNSDIFWQQHWCSWNSLSAGGASKEVLGGNGSICRWTITWRKLQWQILMLDASAFKAAVCRELSWMSHWSAVTRRLLLKLAAFCTAPHWTRRRKFHCKCYIKQFRASFAWTVMRVFKGRREFVQWRKSSKNVLGAEGRGWCSIHLGSWACICQDTLWGMESWRRVQLAIGIGGGIMALIYKMYGTAR